MCGLFRPFFHTYGRQSERTGPLGMQNNITHQGSCGKESSRYLPPDPAGEPSRSSGRGCDWRARGGALEQGCGALTATCLCSFYMLWALKGHIGRTGASACADLVGRWLTSCCPSKCDLGHTFNEIHSTWQAPPLPGLSVYRLPCSDLDADYMCCYFTILTVCVRGRLCVRTLKRPR